ncbi:unnamed protein product [Rotaria sp. Silwood2]|nr:unnamed protein product [Rotaria sp. Silwood2]
MAQCLEDAGVGRWLQKYDFTSEILKQTIETMLNKEERLLREKNIKRIETMTKLHGGVEHAVDLIEMYAEYGIKSLVPINNSFPFYADHNYRCVCNMTICFNWIKLLFRRCCYCRRTIIAHLKKQKRKLRESNEQII